MCGRGRCHRRRRRCHRRHGCGNFFDNDVDIDNVAIADSNAIAINTGDFGDATAVSRADAFNVNDIDSRF
jgi:hypothetical protein